MKTPYYARRLIFSHMLSVPAFKTCNFLIFQTMYCYNVRCRYMRVRCVRVHWFLSKIYTREEPRARGSFSSFCKLVAYKLAWMTLRPGGSSPGPPGRDSMITVLCSVLQLGVIRYPRYTQLLPLVGAKQKLTYLILPIQDRILSSINLGS
jgi:hypothetical protein